MNARATFGSTLILGAVLCACEGGDAAPTKDKPPTGATGSTRPASTTPAQQAPAPKEKAKGPFPQSKHEAMKDPAKAAEKAPDTFKVAFDTTIGGFSLSCTRAWAPEGADRFYNLVKIGFFDDVSFFRAVKGFVVQFGIHGDPEVSKAWRSANIKPDKVIESNKRGSLVYAQAGRPAGDGLTADSRSTQLFFNLVNNDRLDPMGFAPICTVDQDGMNVVDKLYTGYGEDAGRDQASIQNKGNAYLRERYPLLDYIKTARLDDGKATDDKEGDKPKDAPKDGTKATDTADEKAAKAPAKPPEAKQPAPEPKPAVIAK